MDTKKNSTSVDTSMVSSRTGLRRSHNAWIVQNFPLVWLDGSIDKINNDDYRDSIKQLQNVVKHVNIFTDVDKCIDFVTDIEEEKTFMIISEDLCQMIMPIIQNIPQVTTVYIFCENKTFHEVWTQQWSKVKGIYEDITSISETFKQDAEDYDQNSISISFIPVDNGTSKPNLDQLDQSFMYTQILKEILLTIEFQHEHINQFVTYCREQLVDNTIDLSKIEKFQKEYHDHQPIWWYTCPTSLYSMLNKALRTMEVDLIIEMGFFIRDLHQQITAIHKEQYHEHNHSDSFIVYRGQGLPEKDFNQLMKTKGGLMAFNSFLSTSLDRGISFTFADSNQYNHDTIGILFEITINSSTPSSPFANIRNVSYFQNEEEILFSMHSVFRIKEIKQIDGNDRLWEVKLTLTSDKDPQLQCLTECIREEAYPNCKGWHRLGVVLIRMGHYRKAEELYETLFKQTNNEGEKEHIYYHLGLVKSYQREYAVAIRFNEKSIEINQKISSSNPINMANSYSNIGCMHQHMGEYSKALAFHERALEICQKALSEDDSRLAVFYNNIGSVYEKMGEYSKALLSQEKALKIHQKTLPANHPNLATSYNNISLVYGQMGEYSKALSFFEKTLEIYQKTLPTNHPEVATSHSNIGSMYEKMGQYSKALSSYETAFEIHKKNLASNGLGLASSYNDIGSVYNKMGEYSKALSSYEAVLEIYQKNLASNHPDLTSLYNNIGLVYHDMGEYSKALPYYENALEIRQKTVPTKHSGLATSYNNIGSVYNKLGEYSKALSFYEKGLEIEEKTLPENHPHLATSYNNIGLLYYNMSKHSKALSYYEKALEIGRKTLPSNHPDLATTYKNIGSVYHSVNDCSKALLYHEKALEIEKKTLPENHPHLAASYHNIGSIYDKMGEYSKALSCHEKALEIRQKVLPTNHPHLLASYKNLGTLYTTMGVYSKAVSSLENVLEIEKKTLSSNHPDLATSYNNIGSVYYYMGKHSKALAYYNQALDIRQRSLPPYHPQILAVRQNIEFIKKKV